MLNEEVSQLHLLTNTALMRRLEYCGITVSGMFEFLRDSYNAVRLRREPTVPFPFLVTAYRRGYGSNIQALRQSSAHNELNGAFYEN